MINNFYNVNGNLMIKSDQKAPYNKEKMLQIREGNDELLKLMLQMLVYAKGIIFVSTLHIKRR